MKSHGQWCLFGVAAVALVIAGGALGTAQDATDKKPATPPPADPAQPGLPPGWTPEDMQAFIAASTPGKSHEHLNKYVGAWTGKSQMWMGPDSEPIPGEFTQTAKSVMGGRYVQYGMRGEVPGMGMFVGEGVMGYDNVGAKYVASWFDNQSTGIMHGIGELSKDGKTLSWTYNYQCPIRKKPATVRQTETFADDKTMILEAFVTDPKSGKEYKCMRVEFVKKS